MSLIIIIHIILFEIIFFIKSIVLSNKLRISIRGKNKEAIVSIILFSITISVTIFSLIFEKLHNLFYPISFLSNPLFKNIGISLLVLNILIACLALIDMKESWRIGIKEGEKTELITNGIYGISRNPYFLSYIVLFMAYILLIPNVIVIIFSILSIISIHKMILKEELFLEALHGNKYREYKIKVARYFII
ncbi:MAG: isoprenylcysteine carboxylmethyltransferase family protein [Ignavibacteria bacterium]|nr:isoprenylcysteine carboxylmethyltransferase family protein [Ignavibacteria bacterium]